MAEKGFFRQVAVLNPKNGQAQANYAICLQFLRQDYKLAEEHYIKACEADPYDQGIIENFNNMLTKLAGANYDGFDGCFESLQLFVFAKFDYVAFGSEYATFSVVCCSSSTFDESSFAISTPQFPSSTWIFAADLVVLLVAPAPP